MGSLSLDKTNTRAKADLTCDRGVEIALPRALSPRDRPASDLAKYTRYYLRTPRKSVLSFRGARSKIDDDR